MSSTILEKYGRFAARNPYIVIAITLVFTSFMIVNALSMKIETDFTKSLPQNIEAIQNQNLLEDVFSHSSSMFILVKLNEKTASENEIKDIRDPYLLHKLYELKKVLEKSPDINSVSGVPDILIHAFGTIPQDRKVINNILSASSGMLSNDYTMTVMRVEINGGNEQKRIDRIAKNIYRDIESIGFPATVSMTVTGSPIMREDIFGILLDDLQKTVSIAGILILIVLIVAYRSPLKGLFSVFILGLAIIWTAGTMKILDIPLSIITVTVGSLVIGIGIDYAIHIMNRYMEEGGKTKNKEKALGLAVDKTGQAIIGTAITTIVSFIALAGSGVPLLEDMGISLSLGIFYSMIMAIFVFPSLIVVEERLSTYMMRMEKRV